MKMSDVQYVKNDIFWDSSNRFRSVGMTALCAWVRVMVFRLVEGLDPRRRSFDAAYGFAQDDRVEAMKK